jgi:prephenate dehydrogenase
VTPNSNGPWPRRLAVIGTGLLGASVGLAARSAGVESVSGWDASAEELGAALDTGAISDAAPSLEAAVAGADLVVAATPVRSLAPVLLQAHAAAPDAVLTDVGSTKSHLLADLAKGGARLDRVVPGHPMAGSEERGAAAARADLFQGAAWALTPDAAIDHLVLRRMTGFVRALGGRPLVLDPALHDRVAAYASHLPQLAATALMGSVGQVEAPAALQSLIANGFKDTTRIAASEPEIWVDICTTNADAILLALDELRHRLGELRNFVEAGDQDGLRAILVEAQRARRRIPTKPGVPGFLQEVVVHIADRPGSIAGVTAALGAAGINVEDLSIDHEPQGGAGALHVWVAGRKAASDAARIISASGWPAHEAGLVPGS